MPNSPCTPQSIVLTQTLAEKIFGDIDSALADIEFSA